MAQELIYTSARRGLKPGTSGFCTVSHTRGMLPSMVRVAESLSAYKRRSAEHGLERLVNPVVFSHHQCLVNGENFSFLSRVGVSGKDHTNRDNKLAHHIVLRPEERPAAGPAWLAMQDDTFITEWKSAPRYVEQERTVKDGDNPPHFAEHWERVTGDAGWAGVLASKFITRPDQVVYLIFEPGLDPLPLISESLALIAPARRWAVTFSTYFTVVPAGMTCSWRCCLPEQAILKDPRNTGNSAFLDLTRKMGVPPGSTYVQLARGENLNPENDDATDAPARRQTRAPHPPEQKQSFIRMANRHRRRIHLRPEDDAGREETK